MKRLSMILVILTLAALMLGACAQATTAPTQAPAAGQPAAQQPAAAGDKFYVFLPKGLDNPYWDECRKGMEAEMAKLGVKAEFLGPAVSDATKQVEIF